MEMPSRCPDIDSLRRFASGNLSVDELESIASHTMDCSRCDAILRRIEENDDPLTFELRDLPEVAVDLRRKLAMALDEGPVWLDKFELLEELGAGSSGCVFRARDRELERIVALKVHRGKLETRAQRDRFFREARSAAQLDHGGIVSLYETGVTEDAVGYLATEFVDGETLERRLRRGRVPFDVTARWIGAMAEALEYAHARGIIHRDVKPSNTLIDSMGRPRIMDFGLAKRESGEVTMTLSGEVMGTPAYMSPEQARGDSHEVDARSDVYSLGVILYEMLSGERPFQGNRRMLLLQVLEDEPRPLRQLDEHIPRDLETICLKAMARSPARRYASAGALRDDLDRFGRGEAIEARPVSSAERLWRWSRKNSLAVSLMIAISVGSMIAIGGLWNLSEVLARQSSVVHGDMYAGMLEVVNRYYSDLVDRIEPESIELTHEYAVRPNALPIPATFTIEVARQISEQVPDMEVRLYSDHPFPWRSDGGPRDAFETEALAQLRRDPSRAVYTFDEAEGGAVLRHATARRLESSCVQCHNSHPASPKRDWRLGDVRGVLEVLQPVHRERGLRGRLFLIGALAASPLFIVALVFLVGWRNQGSQPVAAGPARDRCEGRGVREGTSATGTSSRSGSARTGRSPVRSG